MSVYSVKRAVLVHKLQRALFADAGYAADIVGRIAHHGLQVDKLWRRKTVHLVYCFCVDYSCFIVCGKVNGDAVAHELIAVAVARHDHTFNIVFFGDA